MKRACNQGYSILGLRLLKKLLALVKPDDEPAKASLPELLALLLIAAAKKGLVDLADYLINTLMQNPKVRYICGTNFPFLVLICRLALVDVRFLLTLP